MLNFIQVHLYYVLILIKDGSPKSSYCKEPLRALLAPLDLNNRRTTSRGLLQPPWRLRGFEGQFNSFLDQISVLYLSPAGRALPPGGGEVQQGEGGRGGPRRRGELQRQCCHRPGRVRRPAGWKREEDRADAGWGEGGGEVVQGLGGYLVHRAGSLGHIRARLAPCCFLPGARLLARLPSPLLLQVKTATLSNWPKFSSKKSFSDVSGNINPPLRRPSRLLRRSSAYLQQRFSQSMHCTKNIAQPWNYITSQYWWILMVWRFTSTREGRRQRTSTATRAGGQLFKV